MAANDSIFVDGDNADSAVTVVFDNSNRLIRAWGNFGSDPANNVGKAKVLVEVLSRTVGTVYVSLFEITSPGVYPVIGVDDGDTLRFSIVGGDTTTTAIDLGIGVPT
jgi:hypothetical protein